MAVLRRLCLRRWPSSSAGGSTANSNAQSGSMMPPKAKAKAKAAVGGCPFAPGEIQRRRHRRVDRRGHLRRCFRTVEEPEKAAEKHCSGEAADLMSPLVSGYLRSFCAFSARS